MRIVKPATLRTYWARYPDARRPLEDWLVIARSAQWRNISDVRRTYPHADAVFVASGAVVTIFNIKGNAYRLITAIHYNTAIVFIRDFMTHAEYGKDRWKGRH